MQEEKDMSKHILVRYTKARRWRAKENSGITISVKRILRIMDKKGLVNKDGKRIKT